MANIELYQLAHARTGDKGNRVNISLIAYRAEDFELLVNEVTEERVATHFAHRKPTRVTRYLLPLLGDELCAGRRAGRRRERLA